MKYTLKRYPRFGSDIGADHYPYFQIKYASGAEQWAWTWRYAARFETKDAALATAKTLNDRYVYEPVQWGL